MAQQKAIEVPLRDRTYIIGYSELMGYLGIESVNVLNRDFIDQGLRWRQVGQKRYFKKSDVDAFIVTHGEDCGIIEHTTRKQYTKKNNGN